MKTNFSPIPREYGLHFRRFDRVHLLFTNYTNNAPIRAVHRSFVGRSDDRRAGFNRAPSYILRLDRQRMTSPRTNGHTTYNIINMAYKYLNPQCVLG